MSRIVNPGARGVHLLAFLVAFITLFVALGGQGYAKDLKLKKNTVTSKIIKNGQVSSSDLKDNGVKSIDLLDGGVGLVDLSPALKAQLGSILDGSVTTTKLGDGSVTNPKLGDGSVTNPKLASDSVTGAKVAANTLTNADIATAAIGAAEIGPNSVSSDEVTNGTLDGVDIGKASGTTTLDFSSIGAGNCDYATPAVPGATTTDQVTVSPRADYNPVAAPVTVYGQAAAANGFIRVVACNVGAAAVDLPPVTFHYTVIDN